MTCNDSSAGSLRTKSTANTTTTTHQLPLIGGPKEVSCGHSGSNVGLSSSVATTSNDKTCSLLIEHDTDAQHASLIPEFETQDWPQQATTESFAQHQTTLDLNVNSKSQQHHQLQHNQPHLHHPNHHHHHHHHHKQNHHHHHSSNQAKLLTTDESAIHGQECNRTAFDLDRDSRGSSEENSNASSDHTNGGYFSEDSSQSITDLSGSPLELKVQIRQCSDEKLLKKNLSQDNLLGADYISRPNDKCKLPITIQCD